MINLTDKEIVSLCKYPEKLAGWFDDHVSRSAYLSGALQVADSHFLSSENKLKLAICVLLGKTVEYEMADDGGWEGSGAAG